ncbi:hypothetical protein [Brytella acorum]|uniref:Uncharacterized protein n=1 Tax=Brytella acorum TaxID=2959299 RepID=A0AA35UEP1_9PROT|nr:hypothetical protein [Brytella acorum]MDF3624467.1 hypothetical protein [Brytella acorum]CAI9119683.1 hypothetical protein LMG32879_000504 [Brytella acorum]
MKSIFSALIVLCATQAAHAGEFTVIDDRADVEISEVSRLYIDGNLAAVFRLDEKSDRIVKKVMTPVGRLNHDYALCGEITITNDRGEKETHRVSSEGVLNNPDGRVFMAYGTNNFTDFYLLDPNDPNAVTHHAGATKVCAAPIS